VCVCVDGVTTSRDPAWRVPLTYWWTSRGQVTPVTWPSYSTDSDPLTHHVTATCLLNNEHHMTQLLQIIHW